MIKSFFFAAAFGSWGMQSIITFVNARATTKLFQHEATVVTHTVHYFEGRESSNDEEDGDAAASKSDAEVDDEEGDDEDGDEGEPTDGEKGVLYQPSGQHLLVDIKYVDADFLDSEDRLVEAMVDLLREAQVTLLSYHCHSRVVGVICVGIIAESHLAVHTFPRDGIIIMDMYTCGSRPLIPILPIIKKLFALPSSRGPASGEYDEEMPEPRMLWSHKRRGFRDGFDPEWNKYENPLDQELGIDFYRKHDLDWKVPLVSEETEFQYVDIVETINPRERSLASYERSLSNDGSYESLHRIMFRPDKTLFLDGVQQSTLYGDAEYHEALVHPAMITHPNPKRVAIIGGGEGATLREVLKHNTVERVMMVEIDGELVELCKQHLPEWSNCTDIVGSDADSCFDDSRALVVYDDAFKWFIDSYGKGETTEEKMDVIIMDALDPDKFVEIVGSLYKDNQFVDALFRGLTDEGVFVAQLGESDTIRDPAVEAGPQRDRANMMVALESVGFKSMRIYDEGHSHFQAPWNYLVAFKDDKSRANWYKSSAEIEIELHRRLHRNKSGKSTLSFFDGPTMTSYQVTPKAQQTVYCRKEPIPWECDAYVGVNPKLAGAKQSGVGRPIYSPVLERNSRQMLTVGAKEPVDSTVARLASAIRETIGKKSQKRNFDDVEL